MATEESLALARETLRAELKDLELRIVDRLNTALESKADAVALTALRGEMQAEFNAMGQRVTKLERFRWAFPSTSVIAAAGAVAAAVAAIVH